MKKKNLVFFLPNFNKGGAANSISKLILNISKKKYFISLICLNKCDNKKLFLRKKIKVFEISKTKTIFALGEIKNILNQIMCNEKKTIFVSNINYANVLSIIFLKKLNNLKIITVDRTPIQELDFHFKSPIKYFKNLIIKILIYFYYKKADMRIGNSKKVSNDIEKFTNSKTVSIYPCPINKINKNRSKKITFKKNFILLWVGRLSKEKSFNTLIDAISLIKKLNTKIFVIGSGPEKKNIMIKLKKLKISHKFKFFGFKKNVNKFYKYSDLYISTSLYEGFQNTLIEAMNNNLPIICSKSHGCSQEILLNGKLGNIYNINDHYQLSNIIKKFVFNPNPFIKKAKLAKNSLSRFNLKKTVSSYETIFDNL